MAGYIEQVELEDGQTVVPSSSVADDSNLLDHQWIQTAFMVADSELKLYSDIQNKYFSSAATKFTDTSIGANIGINPRPQWTRYADIRIPGRMQRNAVSLTNVSGNHGMGSAYSEMIDDPAQKIFMSFGVLQFNSLFNFLSRAFDFESIVLARTGRAPTKWFTLGQLAGTAIAAVSFPGLWVTVGVGKAAAWLFSRQTSKFCTLKPAMFSYWSTVNNLVNNHAVNDGLYRRVFSDEKTARLGKPYKIDSDQQKIIAQLLPGIFTEEGGIDAFAVANQAQRLANAQFIQDWEKLNTDSMSTSDFVGYLRKDNTGSVQKSSNITDGEGKPSLVSLLNKMMMMGDYYTASENDASDTKQELDPRINPNGSVQDNTVYRSTGEYLDNMAKAGDAELRDASRFVCFRVDYTGSVSESFSNSYGESEISQKLNNISQDLKSARFSLADGNIFGGVIDSIQSAVTNLALGTLDSVTMGFAGLIPGLGGSGFIDIPKHWQSSTANLPRGSYRIKLISPYNNPVSRLINIWIPFYMLLAGALPRSIGKQGYTSPPYCQIFDRGRWQSRLAAIESITVTRGTSNLGFDLTGKALAIDIDLSVIDMSSIMHLPISSGAIGEFDVTMDEDNIASDYFNVLAGMDIYSQVYAIPKAQIAATKLMAKLKHRFTSPHYHAALFRNVIEDNFLTGPMWSLLQAPVAGSAMLEGDRS